MVWLDLGPPQIIQDNPHAKILDRITSASILFPNKITCVGSRDWDRISWVPCFSLYHNLEGAKFQAVLFIWVPQWNYKKGALGEGYGNLPLCGSCCLEGKCCLWGSGCLWKTVSSQRPLSLRNHRLCGGCCFVGLGHAPVGRAGGTVGWQRKMK